MLLHGGGANAHWWDHIAPTFADQFHVVALDFRGHGDSERPEELIPGAFNEDLEAILRDLGHQPATLVGHSMGANVALAYAATHSLRCLVLVDPARGGTARNRRRMRLALTLRQSYPSREEAIERFRFLPDAETTSESLRLSIARHSVEPGPDGRWRYKFDSRWFGLPGSRKPDVTAVSCPVLVMRGEQSGVLSAEAAVELAESFTDGECAEIQGAGHHLQLDQPEAFIASLRHFLARHSPSRP